MEYVDENETIVEPDDDGGWVSTHNTETTTNSQTNTTQDDKTSEIQLDSDKVIYSTCTPFHNYLFSCNQNIIFEVHLSVFGLVILKNKAIGRISATRQCKKT